MRNIIGDNRQKSYTVISFLVILITYSLMIVYIPEIYGGGYADEVIYITAGKRYIVGQPPYFYNFEHPPLAKYLIGLSLILFNEPRVLNILMGFLILLIVYALLNKLTNCRKAFWGVLLLAVDTIFVKVSKHALLEPSLMFFTALAIYFSVINVAGLSLNMNTQIKRYIAEGISWGLALASKLSCLYVLIFSLFFRLLAKLERKMLKMLLVISVCSITSYTITYLMDFIHGGLELAIKHNVDMLSYMAYKHSPTLLTIINGFFLAFLKIEIWPKLPNVFMTLFISNESIINYTMETIKTSYKLEVIINPAFGSFILPLAPYLYTYIFLVWRRLSDAEKYLAILGVASFALLIHGSIPWYYYLPTVVTAINLCLILNERKLLVILLSTIIYYLILVFLNLNEVIYVSL